MKSDSSSNDVIAVYIIRLISLKATEGERQLTTGKGAERTKRDFRCPISLRASSPIWASETSLTRTRERAAKPRGARSREARFACPNRRLVPNLQLSTLADVTIIKSMLTTLTNSSTIKSKLRIAPCKRTQHVTPNNQGRIQDFF